MNGIESIAAERQRQIEEEGWTSEYDDGSIEGQLAHAAACYAWIAGASEPEREFYGAKTSSVQGWPWVEDWWKPTTRRRDLVKAGALIAAEIDRLDRVVGGGDE